MEKIILLINAAIPNYEFISKSVGSIGGLTNDQLQMGYNFTKASYSQSEYTIGSRPPPNQLQGLLLSTLCSTLLQKKTNRGN